MLQKEAKLSYFCTVLVKLIFAKCAGIADGLVLFDVCIFSKLVIIKMRIRCLNYMKIYLINKKLAGLVIRGIHMTRETVPHFWAAKAMQWHGKLDP